MKSKSNPLSRWLSLVLSLALCLSLVTVPALAEEGTPSTGTLVNTSGDGGANAISLSTGRTFAVTIPVDMTLEAAQAAAANAQWTLLPDSSKPYLDQTLFPNQTKGGPLEGWLSYDGKTPYFTNLVSTAETVDGKVCLKLTFETPCYFGADTSVPHSNGGAYLDVCGYFKLGAVVDGKTLGTADVKVAPYDNFHTMAEIYSEIDKMVAFAAEKTDLYVAKFSMGLSQGDNGMAPMDMPYLIVAKDRAAVDKWLALTAKAEGDPTALLAQLKAGTLGEYQVPVMYSNVHANEVSASDGVLQFGWMLLESAAGDGKLPYDVLTGFTAAGKAELEKQMGPVGKKDSVAIPDLVKDDSTYLGYLKAEGQTVSAPVDLAKYYTIKTETADVKALFDDLFFILVPEENVEGRTYLTRTSSGGFDLNRDNSFQTQAETQNMTKLIGAWNPVSLTEFHGRVKAFQFEPCDPPHEPNFEYDLLAKNLMKGGEAAGIAAVANNDGYNSYVIPQRDYLVYSGEKTADGKDQTQWLDPWDDMSTSYTPQYAMLHGTVAYTVEVPAYNDHTAKAVAYGQLGQSVYVAQNKESYLTAQTQIFERGVTNANSNAYDQVGRWLADQYDVEGGEASLFRPVYDGEGQNKNFYPECYIIPMDGKNQKNLQAAADMMEWLSRNDVQILVSEKEFTYDGVTYPKGTMVITMYQAKRSVANGVLYDGTVITDWPVLYSEGITAFNKTRGFNMATCAEPAAYKTIKAACGSFMDYEKSVAYLEKLTSVFSGPTGGKVILRSTSEDAAAAVNTLLKGNKAVGLILAGDNKGSFLCDWADYQTVSGQYLLNAVGVEGEAPLAMTITKAPVVYISGKPVDNTKGFVKTTLVSGAYQYNYDRQALELMGFTITDDAAKADLIVGAAALDESGKAAVAAGTPYIGYGSNALNVITGYTDRDGKKVAGCLLPDGTLVRETVSEDSMDALAYVTYPAESMVTASYVAEGDDILYGYGAGYFAAVPDGAQTLVQLDGSKELLEGFLSGNGAHYKDFLNNSIQAISYEKNGLDLVLFANTLTNKVHQRDEFGFIANKAFSSVLGSVYTGKVATDEEAKLLADVRYSDVSAADWFATAVGQATAQGLMSGTSAQRFSPNVTINRAMMATILYRLAGSPDVAAANLPDVAADAWYAKAAAWAVQEKVAGVNESGQFAPDAALTREQAVTMLYHYAVSTGADVSAKGELSTFADAAQVSTDAADAMAWAVGAGVVTGTGNGLAPQGTTTRAELITLLLRGIPLFAAAKT